MKKINHSKLRKCLSIFILMHIIFFVGCVSEYHVLKPEQTNFINPSTTFEEIEILYSPDTLLTGNKKFLKKSVKKGYWLLPVKAKNNSNEPITLLKDKITIFNSHVETQIIEPEECFKKLKYSVSGRIAWGAAALATSISFGSFGTFFNYKNPLLLIAAGSPFSIISAGKVNRAFKAELENYDLLNETIMPGMEKSGLICIKAQSVQDILIRIEQ